MFDLEMPPALQPFTYLAGSASSVWSATETGMALIADHFWAFADALEELIPDLARVRAHTQAVLVGEMAAAAERQFALLFDGPYSVGTLVDAARALGDLAANLSELIQYTKLQVIATLAITAATISWALANAAVSGGASLLEAAAAEETATLTIDELVAQVAGRIAEALAATLTKTTVSRLLAETVGSALMGAGQEAGVEGVQALLGGRGGIDVGKVLEAAWSMAAGGGAAGLVGHLVGGVLGPAKNLLEQMGKGALTAGAAAEAAFEASALAGGSQPPWQTLLLGGLIGVGHGAAPGGEHATAGHEPAERVVDAGGRPAPVPVERLTGEGLAAEHGAAGVDAVNGGEVAGAAVAHTAQTAADTTVVHSGMSAGGRGDAQRSLVVESSGLAEGSHGRNDPVDNPGVRRYADGLVGQGSIDPHEVSKRVELAGQASVADRGVIDAGAREAGARTQLLHSVAAHEAAVHERDTELAGYREGRVPVDQARVAAAHQALRDADAGLVFPKAAVESARTERDRVVGEAAAASDPESRVARQQRLADAHQRVADAEAGRAAGEAAVAAAKERLRTAIDERTAELEDAVGSAQERMDQARQVFDSAAAAHDEALRHAVDEHYTQLQAERQKVFDAADARTARVRAEAAESRKEVREQAEKAQAAVEKSRDDHETRKAEYEARKKGHLEESIQAAKRRVGTVRDELQQSRDALAEELRAAQVNGVEPDREVVDRLRRKIEHRTMLLRRKMAAYEALLKAAGDHEAELADAQAQRDNELELSWWGKRGFDSDVDKQVAKWRDELAGHERAARSDLLEEAQRRLEQDQAAYEAAKANEKTVQLEVFTKLKAETQVAGEEYIRAADDGLLDWKTANERFDEQRGPVSKEAALAQGELRQMLGLRGADSARLTELLWSGDETLSKLAAAEIGSRSLGKDENGKYKNAYWTQEQLVLVVDTEAAGRRVSGNMLCGEGKSVATVIYGLGKSAEVAKDGLVVRVTTSRSHLASKGFTDFLKALSERDHGVDVHYIDSADKPMPAPRPGRATLYVIDTDTEHFADLKGNAVPRGPELGDEGDESKIWKGGGDRVGAVYKISKGAAQLARDEVADQFNSGAKFLSDNVGSGDLTPEHFGVDPTWGYGKVHVSEENRAEIQRVLTEQGRHDIGVDDVVKAAVAQYQYRRDIDYVVADVVVDGKPERFVFLIDRVNGEVRHDPETNNDVRITNDIHKALEAKENVVERAAGGAGVPIRHDAESSVQITTQQYYNKRRELGDEISTISGTNTESSELMAANYDGLGPVVRIEKYNDANVHEEDQLLFDNQDAKRAWMAEEINRTRETGQPVVVGADRNDKPRALSKLLTEMNIPHRVIGDAQYQIEHGARWRQDMEADLKTAGGQDADGKGMVTLLSQTGGRGSDLRVLAEATDLGGIYLIGDGRSGITEVVDTQLKNRVGRAGDPGRFRWVLSRDDDVFTQIHDPDAQLAITMYENAAQAHAGAEAAHRADPSEQNAATLAEREQARDAQAGTLLELIPTIQHNTQQKLSTPAPLLTVGDVATAAAAAQADRGSVEQMATPLAGAAQQLAFAQQHFAQRGVTPQITLSDTSILTATQFADVFSRDTLTPAVPLQSAPPGGGWHDADTADLVARLLDDTDPTDLAFLLTTSPAGSEQHQSVWTLTTSEGGQLLLHEVAAAPTDTNPDAAGEYDHLCANEADVHACIRLQPGTTLHAIIADRDGAIIAQPPADIAVLASAGSRPARAAAGTLPPGGAFGRRGPGVPSSDRARLGAQGDAQHKARLQSLRAHVEGVATEHADPLAPRGADVLSLPMHSPGAAGPVELNKHEAEQAQNAVHVLGDPDRDWRSAEYALYRVLQGMPPLDAAQVARFRAAERLGIAAPHLLDPAKLTAILARTTGAPRADVDQNSSVAGRDDGVATVPVGLHVDPAVVAVANQALAQRGPPVRADELVHPLRDPVAADERARANAVWWKGLRDDQRRALIAAYPRQIGHADGIPGRARHEANSRMLQRDLAVRDELVARRDKGIALSRHQVDYIEQINGIEEALREAQQRARQAGVGGPNLWAYEPSEGRVIVWFGHAPDGGEDDPYSAKSVSWYLPGMGTTIGKLPLIMRRALNQLESVRREDPQLPAASFAYIGYRSPGMRDPRVAGLSMARDGGQTFYTDIVGFNAGYDEWAGVHFNDHHVFGHGYGSVALGFAGQGGRLGSQVRTVTLVGSPGAGPIQHAREFGIGEDNVYIASSSRDPVTGLGGRRPGQMGRFPVPRLGPDPAMDFWGGRRVTSEFPAEVDRFGQGSLFTHSLYWDYVDPRADSPVRWESLANFGRIAAGKRVYTEARRTVVRTDWRRQRTHDPAAVRRHLRLVDDPDTPHPTGKRHWFNPRWHTGFNPRWHTGPPAGPGSRSRSRRFDARSSRCGRRRKAAWRRTIRDCSRWRLVSRVSRWSIGACLRGRRIAIPNLPRGVWTSWRFGVVWRACRRRARRRPRAMISPFLYSGPVIPTVKCSSMSSGSSPRCAVRRVRRIRITSRSMGCRSCGMRWRRPDRVSARA
jgi:hypothetical protein